MIPMNNNGKVYIVMGYFKDCDVPLKVFSNEDTAAAFANIMLGPAVDEGQIDIIERVVDDTTFEGYDDDGDECDEDECEEEEECDEEDKDDEEDKEETEDINMKHAREELENLLSFLEFIDILQKIKEEK